MRKATIALLLASSFLAGCKKSPSNVLVYWREMTKTEMEAASSPAKGEVIKCSDCPYTYYISTAAARRNSWEPLQ